ncbi:hypothetical protein GCM10010517_51190 [Streptosporangium fragile]|uniref:Uncharacterized protein n=1 Tax=Streptosporangium fragile TaxID=46186 RepID=A0ABP6IKT7_9ACTN
MMPQNRHIEPINTLKSISHPRFARGPAGRPEGTAGRGPALPGGAGPEPGHAAGRKPSWRV